ncbi:VOC family protein [Micromonospora sp. PLK6-60]|uniref:VOC family protein n=1 Tax=Micromonospora sp. PLK6-60 TaxID=2873383 RepID=UPI001CA63574|nr:VOC family protein [Micromonospora sp. PLK6-60]MBY8873924.1 VOC family protein [Micromonospora sp. PLK6-60]
MSDTPITWFEIGTDRPAEAERFYGEMFGWSFEEQGGPAASYRVTAAGGEQGIGGAIRVTEGQPPYAIFYAEVADVADACRRAEAAGGKVVSPPRTAPSGLVSAHLVDPVGNRLGVFTPPTPA